MRTSQRLCSITTALLLAASIRPSSGSEPIRDAVQPFVDRHELAGAVTMVAAKDSILDVEAFGYADIAAGREMTPDALFWIASMSKPITATAVMMLVDEGKLSLDDPIEKYLPEFKGLMVVSEQDDEHTLLRRPSQLPTVRHVLSHTSGMRFSSPLEVPTLDRLELRDSVRSHALQPLQWEPGSRYQYSNAGINTAARIIEVVTGQSYADFMQQRLFDPLIMPDTTFWPSEEQVARLAKSYKPNADKTDLEETTISQLTYPLTDRARTPMPAGGLFSTAADLTRFCQMILNDGELDGVRYLSSESVHAMTNRQTGEGIKEDYGLGWSTGGGTFGHGGAMATNMTIDPARDLITIWMVQHAGFPGNGNQAQGAFRQAASALAPAK